MTDETNTTENLKDVVVIYHGNCTSGDGFGAAFAAWKKYGDEASYVPLLSDQRIPPEGLVDKQIFILDYSFTKDILEKLKAENKSVVVIDHHESAREDVTAFPENVFDTEHSGAVLAWKYFHTGVEVPKLLLYIEDNDLWSRKLEHIREFSIMLGEYKVDFETWDTLSKNFEDKDWFDRFIYLGGIIIRFEDRLVSNILSYRELIRFEEHECYAVNASRVYRSILGHKLAKLSAAENRAPMGITYYRVQGGVHCSLRSNGDFDVAKIATKYGGGGHKNAASFTVDDFSKLPFIFLNAA